MIGKMIGLVCLFALAWGCASRSPLPASSAAVPSPSGQYLAATSVSQDPSDATRYLCVIIQITDATSGKLLYRQNTGASDRSAWSIAWEGNDKLVLHSGDIGTYAIQRRHDGVWTDDLPRQPNP